MNMQRSGSIVIAKKGDSKKMRLSKLKFLKKVKKRGYSPQQYVLF